MPRIDTRFCLPQFSPTFLGNMGKRRLLRPKLGKHLDIARVTVSVNYHPCPGCRVYKHYLTFHKSHHPFLVIWAREVTPCIKYSHILPLVLLAYCVLHNRTSVQRRQEASDMPRIDTRFCLPQFSPHFPVRRLSGFLFNLRQFAFLYYAAYLARIRSSSFSASKRSVQKPSSL